MIDLCQRIQTRLATDQPLDGDERRHLLQCADCARLASLLAALPTPPADEPPAALDRAILQAARQRHAPRLVPWPRLAWAAAALVALCLGLLAVYQWQHPATPRDELARVQPPTTTVVPAPANDAIADLDQSLLDWKIDDLDTQFLELEAELALLEVVIEPADSLDSVL